MHLNQFAIGMVWYSKTIVFTALLLMSVGCSALKRGDPLPHEPGVVALPMGVPGARMWGDEDNGVVEQRFMVSLERERVAKGLASIDELGESSFLAISGGGSDGAYGAGLLCGWTAHGDRPEFKIVTGISTGALIAPFAFLGPDYDFVLREVYTSVSTKQIATPRSWISGLLSDGMTDVSPLRKLIAKHVDQRFLDRVAEEARKGRILLLGTTNLDSQRPVMWSMGGIAISGHPNALELFREVMIASASIPGAFPPVMIDSEVDGKKYQEMHVDGGVSSQVFLYPASFSFKKLPDAQASHRKRRVYVIRNGLLNPQHEPVRRRVVPITVRSVSTLIKSQGLGDLYRIYLGCLSDGIDYNLACIPEDFKEVSEEAFDPKYMKLLFERGYEAAVRGYEWRKTPPGIDPMELSEHP